MSCALSFGGCANSSGETSSRTDDDSRSDQLDSGATDARSGRLDTETLVECIDEDGDATLVVALQDGGRLSYEGFDARRDDTVSGGVRIDQWCQLSRDEIYVALRPEGRLRLSFDSGTASGMTALLSVDDGTFKVGRERDGCDDSPSGNRVLDALEALAGELEERDDCGPSANASRTSSGDSKKK